MLSQQSNDAIQPGMRIAMLAKSAKKIQAEVAVVHEIFLGRVSRN